MKSAFAAMLRAGITNAVFSARCDFLDRRGFLALNQIQTPTEMAEEHAWVRPGHWKGPVPRPGEEIRFQRSPGAILAGRRLVRHWAVQV